MPPLYAFGFMACYWGWLNAADVTSNMTAFRTGKFPIDSFIMDYDWFNCGTSGGACADKGTDFGYSAETFPHPVQQLSDFHTKWHMKFAGIRKPRTYDHLALANESGWLLKFSGAGVQGNNNFNYSHPDMRAWCVRRPRAPGSAPAPPPSCTWRRPPRCSALYSRLSSSKRRRCDAASPGPLHAPSLRRCRLSRISTLDRVRPYA